MGKSLVGSSWTCWLRFSMLLDAFSTISWSSMSPALSMSDAEGISSWALFKATACFLDNVHSDMSKT